MAVHAILAAIVLVWLVPSVGLLITSFRPRADIASSGWWTLNAARLTLENYAEVLGAQGMGAAFWNSTVITVPATLLTVLVAALAAYGFAWGRFRGRNIMFLVVISLLVVPPQILLVPVLRLSNQAGLTRILPGYLARPYRPRLASGRLSAAQFLRRTAGRIGRGRENRWRQRMAGVLAGHAAAVGAGNRVPHHLSIHVDMERLAGGAGVDEQSGHPAHDRARPGAAGNLCWHIMSSAAFISMAVPLAVFFALQRFFITGITAGAVKT